MHSELILMSEQVMMADFNISSKNVYLYIENFYIRRHDNFL
jgi:hypothetical protein